LSTLSEKYILSARHLEASRLIASPKSSIKLKATLQIRVNTETNSQCSNSCSPFLCPGVFFRARSKHTTVGRWI